MRRCALGSKCRQYTRLRKTTIAASFLVVSIRSMTVFRECNPADSNAAQNFSICAFSSDLNLKNIDDFYNYYVNVSNTLFHNIYDFELMKHIFI